MSELLYNNTGGLFPLMKYLHGMASNEYRLNYLVNVYKSEIDHSRTNNWRINEKQVVIRDRNFWANHPYGPILKKAANEWEYNQVIDYYTESARVATPGYGSQYSPQEMWEKEIYRSKYLTDRRYEELQTTSPEQFRNAIHNVFQEARLAKVTDSIGLYTRIKNHYPRAQRVLDIHAYGDRMVAAANCRLQYVGIDPDVNLAVGISKLRVDLAKIVQSPDLAPETYSVSIEGFWPTDKFDIITLSPPPFQAEPYEGGGELQTHRMYQNSRDWFNGFLHETLTRCAKWIKRGGILGFSVLDRNPTDSRKIKLVYTEAMIFLAESLGFEFIEIFGFPSTTPWWLFRYTGIKSNGKLEQFYGSEYGIVAASAAYYTDSPLLEYIRKNVNDYLNVCVLNLKKTSDLLSSSPTFDDKKIKQELGRLLMSRLNSTDDPFFINSTTPIAYDNFQFFDFLQNTNNQLVLQNSNSSYYYFVTGDSPKQLLVNMYEAATCYIRWIFYTNRFQRVHNMVSIVPDQFQKHIHLVVTQKDNEREVISFLREYVPFGYPYQWNRGPRFISLWETSNPYGSEFRNNALSTFRYATLNLFGHHFTRPVNRLAVIKEAEGAKNVIDLFATPFNKNSRLYASLYPDVDYESLGNFFELNYSEVVTIYSPTFLANPPDYSGFLQHVGPKLNDILSNNGVNIYVGTTLYENVGQQFIDEIRAGRFPDFPANYENKLLTYIWENLQKYLQAVYLLNKNVYPTVNPITRNESLRTGSESLGVILSSKPNWQTTIKINKLRQLGTLVVNPSVTATRNDTSVTRNGTSATTIEESSDLIDDSAETVENRVTATVDDEMTATVNDDVTATVNDDVTATVNDDVTATVNDDVTVNDEMTATVDDISIDKASLELRKMKLSDFRDLNRILNQPSNIAAHGRKWSQDSIYGMIQGSINNPNDLFWTIWIDNKIQGYIGLVPINRTKPPKFTEIVGKNITGMVLEIYLSEDIQNQGWFLQIMREVFRLVNLPELWASTYSANIGARKAFAKIGMIEIAYGKLYNDREVTILNRGSASSPFNQGERPLPL